MAIRNPKIAGSRATYWRSKDRAGMKGGEGLLKFHSIWLSFSQHRWEKRDRQRHAEGVATWLANPLAELHISAGVSHTPRIMLED